VRGIGVVAQPCALGSRWKTGVRLAPWTQSRPIRSCSVEFSACSLEKLTAIRSVSAIFYTDHGQGTADSLRIEGFWRIAFGREVVLKTI